MPSVGTVTSNLNVVRKVANYTAAGNDLVLADSSVFALTITLPAGPALNTLVAVKKIDSSGNLVTVVPGAGATIQGDSAMGLSVPEAAATLQYDGTDWQLLSTAITNATPTTPGLPTGGSAGQALLKGSGADYDAGWATPTVTGTLPVGGSTGDVLAKNTGASYDAGWAKPMYGGTGYPWGGGAPYYGYYFPPFTPTTISSMSIPSNQLVLFPVMIPNACTIGNMSVMLLTSSSGQSIWFGVFTHSYQAASGGPNQLLASGTYTSTGNTQLSATLNYAIQGPTPVWYGVMVNSTMSVYAAQLTRNMLMTPSDITGELNAKWNYKYTTAFNYSVQPAVGSTSVGATSYANFVGQSGVAPLIATYAL